MKPNLINMSWWHKGYRLPGEHPQWPNEAKSTASSLLNEMSVKSDLCFTKHLQTDYAQIEAEQPFFWPDNLAYSSACVCMFRYTRLFNLSDELWLSALQLLKPGWCLNESDRLDKKGLVHSTFPDSSFKPQTNHNTPIKFSDKTEKTLYVAKHR